MQPAALADETAKAAERPAGVAAHEPAGTAIDLSYVPSTSMAFFAVRPAAIFQRAEFTGIGRLLNELGKVRNMVVPPMEIEQFTRVLLSLPEKVSAPAINAETLEIYQIVKPNRYAEEWVRRMPGAKRQEFEGKRYFVGQKGPFAGGVYCPNDRV